MNANSIISAIFANYFKTFTFTLCMVLLLAYFLLNLHFTDPGIWVLALGVTLLSLFFDLTWKKSRLRKELHKALISPLEEIAVANRFLATGDEKGRKLTLSGNEPEEILKISRYRDEMLARIEELNKTLKRELELAGVMQQTLLGTEPKKITGLESAFQYLPYSYAGGDLYDMKRLSHTKAGLLIGDVSGHGVDSAMATMLLKTPFAKIVNDRSVADVMRVCNDLLFPVIGTQPLFFTLSYALFDIENKEMTLSLGGHPPPIHTAKEGCKLIEHPGGFIVGKFEEVDFEERRYQYENGDRFYFYTDGLIEAENSQGVFFGTENLLALVCETKTLPLNESVQKIVEEVKNFTDGVMADDVLLYAVEISK